MIAAAANVFVFVSNTMIPLRIAAILAPVDAMKFSLERIRKGAETGVVPGDYVTLNAKCPNCGSKVKETVNDGYVNLATDIARGYDAPYHAALARLLEETRARVADEIAANRTALDALTQREAVSEMPQLTLYSPTHSRNKPPGRDRNCEFNV